MNETHSVDKHTMKSSEIPKLYQLQNRHPLIQKLGISPVDIVRSGLYRQMKTTTQQGG